MNRPEPIGPAVLAAMLLLPAGAKAQSVLAAVNGTWAIGSAAECARSPYEWSVQPSDGGTSIAFRDRTGRANTERVDAQQPDGFTTTTVSSPDVRAGTRWDYRRTGPDTFIVRNLATGRQFTLVRCAAAAVAVPAVATPVFTDPVALITWLIGHSGRGFNATDDGSAVNVFSPGLRDAIRRSLLRSRQAGDVPCGLDGDILLDTQEEGIVRNLRLSAAPNGPDRVAVAASYEVDGYHRDRRYLTVNLDGAWKLENINESDGSSLRRLLDCRR